MLTCILRVYYDILIIIMLVMMLVPVTKEEAERVDGGPGLLYPEISTIGILAAVAIPLDLVHRNVFVSFGFEAYYLLPHEYVDWFPPDIGRRVKRSTKHSYYRKYNESHTSTLDETMLFTRRRLYTIIEEQLEFSGYNGKSCLLRTICEVNAYGIGDNNGVLGSIIQIAFMPSSSADENLGEEYYEAESNGYEQTCESYHEDCSVSIIEMITQEFT